MSFDGILGQPTATETLARALVQKRAHHAYRFEGPPGVGKELTAFRFAQALMCKESDLGCEKCDACRRAITLSESKPNVPLHPDVVLLGRGVYGDFLRGDGGKKAEEKNEISIQQIRQIVLPQVGFAPSEGKARVFIIRDADELGTGAANALLKTLEEPREGTHFVLLTSRPDRMLPTIRSRSMPVRFGALPTAVMQKLLREAGVPADEIDELVSVSEGSLSVALDQRDPEQAARRRAFVSAIVRAAQRATPGTAAAFGEQVGPDRSVTRANVLALATHLARAARQTVEHDMDAAADLATGHQLALELASEIETANASPSLSLTRLVLTLARSGAARALDV